MTEIKDVDRALTDKWYSDEFLAKPLIERLPIILSDAAAHREAAEKAERDRIVAWIRAGGANVIVETHPAYLRDLAGAIERGEHLK